MTLGRSPKVGMGVGMRVGMAWPADPTLSAPNMPGAMALDMCLNPE